MATEQHRVERRQSPAPAVETTAQSMNNSVAKDRLASEDKGRVPQALTSSGDTPSNSRHSFSLLGNPGRVLRATLTNLFARFAPSVYVRVTGQTGRGAASEEGATDIAQYFRDCVDDYVEHLGLSQEEATTFFAGKLLLEYGPGDLPGVAALMIAKGAQKVYCVDRFPMVKLSAKNARVIADLIDSCKDRERERILACLADPMDLTKGFSPDRIEYLVRPSGLSGLKSEVDFVYSRAVLEHVNDLKATFRDMADAMRPGAKAIHQVDLRSHGLHKANRLDFLAWSPRLWNAMYSHKGVPNRLRADSYRSLLARFPFELSCFEPTHLADAMEVHAVRELLPQALGHVSDRDLMWLGFWLVLTRTPQ